MKHTLVQSFRDYSNDDLYATRGMSRLPTLRMPLITENRILPRGTHGRIASHRMITHVWYHITYCGYHCQCHGKNDVLSC